jgi:mono/diheme cytochrome c family protein
VESSDPSGENVNRSLAILGIASLACAGALFAQSSSSKPGSTKKPAAAAAKDPAAAKRGHDVFQEKCSVCHFDTSEAKKIGPGLKGLNKRGTFSVNGNKVTDENLKTWIENGDSLMPPFKDVLEEAQIKDVIAYVKTL